MGKPYDRVRATAKGACGPTWRKRGWAALPLLVPALAGIAYLALLGAPLMAAILTLSLVTSLALIFRAPGADSASRFAPGGALTGFILVALLADYPTPLIGYGAASILGLGLALPAIRKRESA